MKRVLAGILFCAWMISCTAQVDTTRHFRLAEMILAQADTSSGTGTLRDVPYSFPSSFLNFHSPVPYANPDRRFLAKVYDDRETSGSYVNANGLFKPNPGDSIRLYVCFGEGKIRWAIILDANRFLREIIVFTNGDTSVLYTYLPGYRNELTRISCGREALFYRTWYISGRPCEFYYKGAKPGGTVHYSLHENGTLRMKNYQRGAKSYSLYWSNKGVLLYKAFGNRKKIST
jgi:hypothetical protein